MSLLIIIAQILAVLLAVAIVLSLMTALLPVGVETHEINTDKMFRGALLFWGGMLKIAVTVPLEPGWKKRVVDKMTRSFYSAEHLVQGIRKQTAVYERIWSVGSKAKNRLPAHFWRQIHHTVKLEPWQGTITLGVENPACTGMLYGTAQSFIAAREWPNLYAEADFVSRKSRFVGNGRVKIYPARIVFLAVKYGFKSLKLFRWKKARGAGIHD
ncbi:MAG: hypothetical protein K9N34_03585 [Candidatus Marinimicrobia bacterium]|nr:hypothetical protein [Candidatus Neomarinimicrobiota bacterium]MCF7839952.1 hypothetical protein [Candidatus Neomarinimicrobiota bacterium]MCF7902877.1 hypothetical protein [Candidatus Neomarinimicrobiota bacterium]